MEKEEKSVFITAKEASEILRYRNSKEKIYILLRAGILKGFKRGTMWLIDRKSFEKWCRNQCGLL